MRVAPAALIIVGTTLAAYHNSFPGIFILDDFSSVIDNASIRQLWPPTAMFSPPVEAGVGGRPLANFTFGLNYAISGRAAWSYHAFNLALHVLNALTLFGLVRRTLQLPALRERFRAAATPLALAAATLWSVHPLATAVVNYVSQRTEALMALCLLLTLYGFMRATNCHPSDDKGDASKPHARRWLVFSISACGLGMASKEVMVSTPVIVWLFDRTFVAGSFRAAWRARRGYYLALASSWLVLAALMATSRIHERGVGFDLGVDAFSYALVQSKAVLIYLKLAVWPNPLVFDYGPLPLAPAEHVRATAVAGLALAGLVLVAVVRRPMAGFLGACFLLILAPTSSFIPIVQQPVAESRAYLPLAAVMVLLVTGGYRLARGRILPAGIGAAAIALALGGCTFRRNDAYRSEIFLWTDTYTKRVSNVRAPGNLGAALLRAGQTAEAVPFLEAALRGDPHYADAGNNLGLALARLGRFDEAIAQFQSALRLRPRADTHYNLGEALARAGRNEEAIVQFESALRRNPLHAKAHNNLGVVLLSLGRTAAALDHDRAAVELDPAFAEAHYNLGNALATSGAMTEAENAFAAALRLDPAFAKAHHNLGVLRLRAGDRAGAIAHFEAALRVKPDYAEARRNLELVRQPHP
ncbi:MAG TPA: tetratricopeptide repeat protein [Opitutaceae bacterium]|nr:tetratricopeptide repeat protein [Opitutaceae bacterium]